MSLDINKDIDRISCILNGLLKNFEDDGVESVVLSFNRTLTRYFYEDKKIYFELKGKKIDEKRLKKLINNLNVMCSIYIMRENEIEITFGMDNYPGLYDYF